MFLKKAFTGVVFSLFLLGGFFMGCRPLLKPITKIPPKGKSVEQKSYWDVQRKGANFFNQIESSDRLRKAAKLGLAWIRLTPSKWVSSRAGSKEGDFLIGSRAHYDGLVTEDVHHLKRVLDAAAR